MDAALDSQNRPPTSDESARYDATVRHDGNSFMSVLPVDDTFLVRSDTVERLRSQLADAVVLWTQVPCEPEQMRLALDDGAAKAASS